MTMPVDLFLLRHGNSEGNKAQKLLKEGKIGLDHPIFKVPDNKLRLTALGIEQARSVHDWFEANFDAELHGFCSPYARTAETAYHANLNTGYRMYYALVERNWSDFHSLSDEQRDAIDTRRKLNPLYTPIANGQSLHDLMISNWVFFANLHKSFSNRSVIAVCHGERMWSLRYMIERMTDSHFENLQHSSRKSDRIRNCQIIHYSRKDPTSGKCAPHLNWMRSFCPWDLRDKDLRWKTIERPLLNRNSLHGIFKDNPLLLSGFADQVSA